jgi:hypothetical protein
MRMTELRDGDELAIEVPDGVESCLAYPPNPGSESAMCKSIDLAALAPPPARLVAAGAVRVDGAAAAARFALSFLPDTSAAEPTADTAREFGAREIGLRTAGTSGLTEGGPPGAGSVDILAVAGSPQATAPTIEVVTVGGVHCARATFTLDLRERGHDAPVHFASYGVWSHSGLYAFTVQGDAYQASSIDSLADDAARTLQLKAPAAPAPTDVARIGARLGQMGLIILILLATTLAILGARRRKMQA